MNINEYLDKIKHLSIGKTLYIVGYGNFGKRLGIWLDNKGIIWKGFVDRNKYINEKLFNKPVFQYEESFQENALFIISSDTHKETMIASLRDRGIDDNQIIKDITREIIYEIIQGTNNIKAFQEEIKKYHNIYDNRRCFVVGNGPSLSID